MIVDKQIDFFWLIVSMGHSLGSQIEPVGRPGPHKAAKSTQQGCQEQADRAIRGQMDPARAPEAARSSQLRPDRASQGGPGRLAGRPADCATASSPAGQLDKPRRGFSIWIDSIKRISQKFSICVAVAGAAGALRAAGLGTAARGPLARRRRPHKLKILKFLAPKILVRNWPEIGPNGPQTDPERIPNGPQMDPEWIPNGPRTDPERSPGASNLWS